MFVSIIAAVRDVFSVKSINVLCKTVFFTVLSYILAFTLVYFVLLQVNLLSINWLDRMLDIGGFLLTVILSLFVLPSILSFFSEFFADDIIDAVEARLFEKLPKKKPLSFIDYFFISCGLGLKSLFFAFGLGLLYILFLPFFMVPFAPLAILFLCSISFWLATGFVLAKGYFDTMSVRYLESMEAAELWDKNKMGFIFIGVLSSFLYTVPFINIIAPIYTYSLTTRYFWKVYKSTLIKHN